MRNTLQMTTTLDADGHAKATLTMWIGFECMCECVHMWALMQSWKSVKQSLKRMFCGGETASGLMHTSQSNAESSTKKMNIPYTACIYVPAFNLLYSICSSLSILNCTRFQIWAAVWICGQGKMNKNNAQMFLFLPVWIYTAEQQ